MPTSVNFGQYDAKKCHQCGGPIESQRDGRMWVNGWRICMPCAKGAKYVHHKRGGGEYITGCPPFERKEKYDEVRGNPG